MKHKTVKKAKTLSRLKFDKNKNKYVEISIPPQDAIIGQVQDSDYTIQRIDLVKKTHGFLAQDAQSTLEALASRYDEDKVKKDHIKARIEKLTSILIKVTKSSEVVEPMATYFNDQVVKRAE